MEGRTRKTGGTMNERHEKVIAHSRISGMLGEFTSGGFVRGEL